MGHYSGFADQLDAGRDFDCQLNVLWTLAARPEPTEMCKCKACVSLPIRDAEQDTLFKNVGVAPRSHIAS